MEVSGLLGNTRVTIAVPVGPQPEYKQYLKECLDSIEVQMQEGDQIIIVDDQAHIKSEHVSDKKWWVEWEPDSVRTSPYVIWESPWLIGCADAWNAAISMASNDLVLLMGSDDVLLPGALDALREAYEANNHKDAWYNLTIEITEGPDTGIHTLPNNAAAVTRGLWQITGGFGPSAFAAPDAWLISILLKHMPDRIIQVKEGVPLYWCRWHDAQDTRRQAGAFNQQVIDIRNIETGRFIPNPTWAEK